MVNGAALGKLPDLIEPAVHPHHRQFFHSVVVAAGLVAGIRKLYQWAPDDDFEKLVRAFLLVGGAAYLSHLALDALTSRSLPLARKGARQYAAPEMTCAAGAAPNGRRPARKGERQGWRE